MTLGERIKELRKEQGLTLVELAGSKITKGMLSLIENNKSKPSMETLEYLADQLGVTVSHLTQQGDPEWTKAMVERKEFNNIFEFPDQIIEEEVLPNLDKIAQSQDGMTLYHVIRVYYRYIGEPEKAEEITKHIEKFYRNIGLENLAIKDKMNNAVSMLYERDYKNAYETTKNLESEVEKYKEYDSDIYISYLFWRSTFAVDFNEDDLLKYGALHLEECFKKENFKYYYLQNVILGLYYSNKDEMKQAEVYQENLRKYLAFNHSQKYQYEVMDKSKPLQVRYLLNDNPDIISIYESYVDEIIKLTESNPSDSQVEVLFIEQYLPIFRLEIAYFKNDYEYVFENFSYNLYERPQAQHPLDRLIFAIRSMVYSLSLFKAGRVEEARASYNKIEDTVSDIKDSIFAKEMHMIREIIFK